MNFIKRNIGLVAYFAVTFAVAIVLCVFIYLALKKQAVFNKKVATQAKFYADLKKLPFGLNRKNKNIAEKNSKIATQHIEKLKENIVQKYDLTYGTLATGIDAKKFLREKIEVFKQILFDNGVQVQDMFFSFSDICNSSKTVPKFEIRPILRNLQVVGEIISLAGKSKIEQLSSIKLPMKLKVQESGDGITNFIPVEVTIVATPQRVQNFINLLSNESKYIIQIRNLSFSSTDQAPNSSLGGVTASGNSSVIKGAINTGGGMGTGSDSMASDMMGSGSSMEQNKELTRRDIVAFKKRFVTAIIRLNVIEFIKPSVADEESSSDDSTSEEETDSIE